MKILYVFQNYRKSYTGLGETFFRELKKVESIQLEVFEFTEIIRNRYIKKILSVLGIRSFLLKQQNKKLLQYARKINPDVILIFKGSDVLTATFKGLRESVQNALISVFNPDDPFNPAACGDNIRAAIPFCNHYFIWTHALVEKLKQAGAAHVHYLPFAWDKDRIYRVQTAYAYDVGFVGNYDEERGKWIYGLADEIKRTGTSISLSVFGDGWKQYPHLNVYPQANGPEYLKTVTSTKINLNILRRQNKGAINMRTFEIPAMNSFMAHEMSEEAHQFFKDGVEVVYFSSVSQLHQLVVHYLAHESERKQIADRAYETTVRNDFTYTSVIKKLLKDLNKHA